MVVIFVRYDSKLIVLYGILAVRFVPVFTKKLLHFSTIDFLSVISSLAIMKLLGKESFCNLDFPRVSALSSEKTNYIKKQHFQLAFHIISHWSHKILNARLN